MDIAHEQTDAIIAKVEKKVKKEYVQAQKEIERKANAYFKSFAEKDKKKYALVLSGDMTQDAYDKWREQQILVGDKWNNLSTSLAKDLSNARNISNSIVKGYMPEAYALNHNYSTYQIEVGTGIDTSYTLYDRQTVERLLRDNPKILPDPSDKTKEKIKNKEIERWSKAKMTSAVTQAILQGESVYGLAKRLRSVTAMDARASLRNARTMITNAQNAGRYNGFRRAKAMGVKFKVIWIATLDNRTRHTHRLLDGQMQEVDEPFDVDGIKIMYPADYGGKNYKVPPDMIYNCRCTIGAAVKGTKLYEDGLSETDREVADGLTYDEWKFGKVKGEKQADEQVKYWSGKVKDIKDKKYSGIWKDDVTVADYPAKKASIQSKKDYYDNEIAKMKAQGASQSKIDYLTGKKTELEEFEKEGKRYEKLSEKLKKAQAAKSAYKTGQFEPNAWDDMVKKTALRYNNRSDADKFHRKYLDSVWDNIPDEGKYAVWKYTENSNPLNKPLSGYHDSWSRYNYVGYDKARWGYEDSWRSNPSAFRKYGHSNGNVDHKSVITNLTKAIDQTELPDNVYLVRGSDTNGLAGLISDGFSGLDYNAVKDVFDTGDVTKAKALLTDSRFVSHSFTSTGIAKDSGFGGEVKYNIYAPKGTHGIYAEPQSYFGHTVSGARLYKTGDKYSMVGSEAEVILQRGTTYRITNVDYSHGNWNIDMEVIEQPDYFQFGDEDTFNKGATRHAK